jgi:hypothetical protein
MARACPLRVCFASYLRQEPGRWPHVTGTRRFWNPVKVQLRFEVPARIALLGEGCRRHRCDLRPLDFRGTAEEAQSNCQPAFCGIPVWRPSYACHYSACPRRASGNLLTITSVAEVVNKRRRNCARKRLSVAHLGMIRLRTGPFGRLRRPRDPFRGSIGPSKCHRPPVPLKRGLRGFLRRIVRWHKPRRDPREASRNEDHHSCVNRTEECC